MEDSVGAEIDDGSAASDPGRALKSAWVTLSIEQAHELLQALQLWAEEPDPKWHAHISVDGRCAGRREEMKMAGCAKSPGRLAHRGEDELPHRAT